MMLFDRKKALNQIIGPRHDDGVEAEHPAHTMAKEAIAAVHAHDHKGFAEATKAMMQAFQSDPDQDGDEHDAITGRAED